MHNKVTAIGNVKTFDAIRKEMKTIEEHLLNVQKADELEWRVLKSLRALLKILDGFYAREMEEEQGKL